MGTNAGRCLIGCLQSGREEPFNFFSTMDFGRLILPFMVVESIVELSFS